MMDICETSNVLNSWGDICTLSKIGFINNLIRIQFEARNITINVRL